MDQNNVLRRLASAVSQAVKPAFTTTRFLLSVMVPVSLAVLFLDRSGLLVPIARLLDPLMHLLGLPGEASLVFISAMLLNNYSAIAVIGTLSLGLREITIVAVMCLIAHNLIIESTVMHKTGSSAIKVVLLRITSAVATAWLLNLIMPQDLAGQASLASAPDSAVRAALTLAQVPAILGTWALQSGLLIFKIAVIVTLLMVAQKLLEEFHVMELLGKIMTPLMVIMGLPPAAGFLWIVANVVGLAYGAAIMIERSETGKMSLSDNDLFNHHAAVSHSLLEDTLLFAAIGVPLLWAILPRLLLAIITVWLERGRRILFRRSFRIGTI